ncbi:hypothetical protein ACVBEH_28615, partial [Roseateles sp. GG27B]
IISPDIGGGFGNKVPIYPGYVCAIVASIVLGRTLVGLLGLPWPKYFGMFDMQANLLGYVPLGLLGFAAALRSGIGLRGALLLGLLPGPLLSLLLETLQYF